MAIVLSILNLAVAVLFVYVGTRKAFRPIPELAEKMPWVNHFSKRNVRLIGYAELAGGLGLVLPGIFGLGLLIPLIAALCLAALMIGAAVYHFRIKDNKGAIPSIVLAGILLLLALYMVL
jgi:hypothetical protein